LPAHSQIYGFNPSGKKMSFEEAIELILYEARGGEDGLLASVRLGQEPGVERMRQLILALGTVFELVEGQTELERKLAAALFVLGSDVPLTISSWASKGLVWRKGFMEDEVYEMLMAVQSIFEDRWLETYQADQAETIH
jgi:hypothetical protein